LCAQVVDQVKIEETPRLADLRARHRAGLGHGLQRVRVQAKEVSGGCQVERAHGG
jgi:hypothetical protein